MIRTKSVRRLYYSLLCRAFAAALYVVLADVNVLNSYIKFYPSIDRSASSFLDVLLSWSSSASNIIKHLKFSNHCSL